MVKLNQAQVKVFEQSSDPTVNEDINTGYQVTNIILNNTTDRAFICVDSTTGAAVWHPIEHSASDIWERTGTTIEPANAGDDVDLGTGSLTAGALISDNLQPETGDTVTLGAPGQDGICDVKDASDVVQVRLDPAGLSFFRGGNLDFKNVNFDTYNENVDDDVFIVIATAKSGWGQVKIGDTQEWAFFNFDATGNVNIPVSSDNVIGTDTDANLCIYNSGTEIRIRNRLGSTLRLVARVEYE